MQVPFATPTRDALIGWIVAAALVLMALAGALGAWAGASYAQAKGDAAIERIKGEHERAVTTAAKALAGATDKARRDLAEEVQRGNALASQLVTQRVVFEAERKTLQRRIQHVSTLYRPAPDADPLPAPRCVFTAGWVRDYNAAIGAAADLPGADPAAPGGGAGTGAGAGDATDPGLLLDSGVTPADILAHVIDYGAHCRGLGAQTGALIRRWETRP